VGVAAGNKGVAVGGTSVGVGGTAVGVSVGGNALTACGGDWMGACDGG